MHDFRRGAGVWQLPERVHLPTAPRTLGGVPRVCVSAMQESNRVLRQHSRAELADSSRTLSQL